MHASVISVIQEGASVPQENNETLYYLSNELVRREASITKSNNT